MLNQLFRGLFDTTGTGMIAPGHFLLCVGASLVIGLLLCLMATALALYHQAGWSFGKANPVRGMTFTLIAGIYAFAAMPAAAGTADLLALTAIGLWMLLHAAVLPGAKEKTAEKPKEK